MPTFKRNNIRAAFTLIAGQSHSQTEPRPLGSDPFEENVLSLKSRSLTLIECSAGHDRTGIVAAYLRMKHQHWPVDKAIAEMRDDGHNWPKFSADGGRTSWHEQHLRALAAQIDSNGSSIPAATQP